MKTRLQRAVALMLICLLSLSGCSGGAQVVTDEMERALQKSHVRRLSKGKCSAEVGIVFTDMVTGLERVADHATNIAFSILDEDPEDDSEI